MAHQRRDQDVQSFHEISVGSPLPPVPPPSLCSLEARDSYLICFSKDLPLVLDEVNVTIAAKEKVGIVGRTGAGKSSLVTAILRLVELDGGRVFIDGVDVSAIGLRRLRSCVAVIPQDPVLFSGTIRSNLDPFNLYTDEQCWEV
jgi:ATP-binding cassette, subfamily C (CFTR/MRP), member 1